ncbi:MAG: hypothetical protein LBR74_01740 [Eubacterium sp.]|jgi:hypothetical protein|nr:hypothetical protein [Eubacterium sp.]
MKKEIKKIMSTIIAISVLVCGSVAAATAVVENQQDLAVGSDIVPMRASPVLASWSPLLSQTSYGADIDLTDDFTGMVTVRLQNSGGATIAQFFKTYTDINNIFAVTSRTTPTGTYRIEIEIKANGISGTTIRNSSYFII